jgi:CheY-like chemotaxis protein
LARKILLADDSVTAQNMGRKILTDAGYEVVAVNNGSAALKKIIDQKPDLIVLDVYMPGYSGLEVCQRIKDNRETARIPVLLTVGKLEPFKPEEARRARADGFVIKPFEASELLSAIAKLEEKIAPQPEPYKQGRFAKAVASLDETENTGGEKFGDSDSGWKSRLRFPGKKKQVEPEEVPEIPAPAKSARDFREEPFVAPVVPAAPAPPTFERPIPTGIPRDITPEEIAAISAAAARLSGAGTSDFPESTAVIAPPTPVPVAEPVLSTDPIFVEPQFPPATPNLPASNPEPSVAGDIAPITFASAPGFGEDRIADEKPLIEKSANESITEEAAREVSLTQAATSDVPPLGAAVPTSPVETVAFVASAATELASAQSISSDAKSQITAPDVAPPLVVEPAPVTDFAPAAFAQAVSEAEVQDASLSTAQGEAQPSAQAPSEAQQRAPSVLQPVPVPPHAEGTAPTASPISEATSSAQHAAPPDEEVMAALQNLIPVNGTASGVSDSQNGDLPSGLVAAVAEFAHAGIPVLRPRWIAEEAALTAEEAALSLEHEMEKAYAAFAASEAARLLATSAIESLAPFQPSQPNSPALVAIPASISELLPSDESPAADAFANSSRVSASSVPDASGSQAVHAMASAAAVGDGGIASAVSPVIPEAFDVAQSSQPPEISEQSAGESPLQVAGGPASPARHGVTDFVVAASAEPEVFSATESEVLASAPIAFESVTASDNLKPSTAAANTDSHPPVQEEPAELVVAAAEATPETISAGETDSMAKNSESGLGFKMIRQSPAGSKSAANVAPVTKENFDASPALAAEPAAMAAAASAETASPVPPMPSGVPDPRAIASIVDSVLAELRPKIVEEIAKKLSEPNKQ